MWYESLSVLEKVFFYIATISSGLLLIRMLILLIGGELFGGDADFDADADVDGSLDPGLRIFSMQGILSFFAVGGWTGYGLGGLEDFPIWATILIALVVGTAALFLCAFLFRLMFKLQADGTIDIKSSVGAIGDVYITVGASQAKTGKISVMVSGRLSELDAVTDSERDLKPGEKVKVVGMLTSNIVIIEPLA